MTATIARQGFDINACSGRPRGRGGAGYEPSLIAAARHSAQVNSRTASHNAKTIRAISTIGRIPAASGVKPKLDGGHF